MVKKKLRIKMQKSFCFKHSGFHSQGKRNLMLFVSDGSA